MIAVSVLAAMLLFFTTIWPDLPFSVGIVRACIAVGRTVTEQATVGRALIAVSIVVALFALLWALQGDAPMLLAMALPEMAAWFTTFEVSALVDGLVGIGSVWLTIRASGIAAAMKSRAIGRHSRQRRSKSAARSAANDDAEPEPRAVAA